MNHRRPLDGLGTRPHRPLARRMRASATARREDLLSHQSVGRRSRELLADELEWLGPHRRSSWLRGLIDAPCLSESRRPSRNALSFRVLGHQQFSRTEGDLARARVKSASRHDGFGGCLHVALGQTRCRVGSPSRQGMRCVAHAAPGGQRVRRPGGLRGRLSGRPPRARLQQREPRSAAGRSASSESQRQSVYWVPGPAG